MNRKTITVGGQAVIEGVMMRAPYAIATAVRRSNGDIVVKTEPFQSKLEKYKFLNVPIVRGAVALIEMLIIGTQSLQYSADMMMEDTEGQTAKKKSKISLILTTVVALGIGIGIFFVGPLFISSKVLPMDANAWQFNLISGLFRVVMFLAYLIAISFMGDIKRLFQYHGAEHQSIYAFEDQKELLPANAITYTTLHPRCGTSFLMFVMITSIICFAVIDSIYMMINGPITFGMRLALHLPFIPVIAGVSYELIKLSGKYYKFPLARIFMYPGLWLQKITTKKPDEKQLEVAIAALKAALGDDLMREYNEGRISGAMSVHECRVENVAN
ncbi:DUF1385 domain-containing protein [bacterium]|nr:DUF1385 domain-containing protein [bacterium]